MSMMDLKIGCHLSSGNGYLAMGKTAKQLNGNTFQFFTRNPRGGQAKPLNPEDIAAYNRFAEENGIGPIIAHAPYTMNLCSKDEATRDFARRVFSDDLMRLQSLDRVLYNFHPGSHVGQGAEAGIRYIVAALNEILRPEQNTIVLLETMAGKGSEIGRSFEELRSILDGVALQDHIGVCLDTCHISDGGYDVGGHLEEVLAEFDRVIGLRRLKAIHLNDSMNPVGSHKDRHEKLGKGTIGFEAFCAIVNHPRLRGLPFVLETPNELDGYAHEIAMLRERYRY